MRRLPQALVAVLAALALTSGFAATANDAGRDLSNVFVTPNGSDLSGNGSARRPWRTLAQAAAAALPGQTIRLAAGLYPETRPAILRPRVNIEGAGQDATILDSSGVSLPSGVNASDKDFKLWYDGSLIQLVSPPYPTPNPRYGAPDEMLPSVDGSQSLSGFSIEGHKRLKAGLWVENRNFVTLHHVTFRNLSERGAVFTKGDMWWYAALPEGRWMRGTLIHDVNFINSGTDLKDESLGNLNIGGLDGAKIYNVNIDENLGYGIKFIDVGHFKNLHIHHCHIRAPERDQLWGEDASIELWNLVQNNEIDHIDANTWFSFVNQRQIAAYWPQDPNTLTLKVHDNRIIDLDGLSGKEAMEVSLANVELFNNYIQDKGFGLGVWGAGSPLKNYSIHHNVFVNVKRTPFLNFGNSAAVFAPDAVQNLRLFNNVFDHMGNTLSLAGARDVTVSDNLFLNTSGLDVEGGQNVTLNHNLKYSPDPKNASWQIGTDATMNANLSGDPGLNLSGERPGRYYAPSGPASFAAGNTPPATGAPGYIGAYPADGR